MTLNQTNLEASIKFHTNTRSNASSFIGHQKVAPTTNIPETSGLLKQYHITDLA